MGIAADRKVIVFQPVLSIKKNAQSYDADMPEPPTEDFWQNMTDSPKPPTAEFLRKISEAPEPPEEFSAATAEKVESVPKSKCNKKKSSMPLVLILILLPVAAAATALFLLFKAGVLIFFLAGFFIFCSRLWL